MVNCFSSLPWGHHWNKSLPEWRLLPSCLTKVNAPVLTNTLQILSKSSNLRWFIFWPCTLLLSVLLSDVNAQYMYSSASLNGNSQQRPPSLMWPQRFGKEGGLSQGLHYCIVLPVAVLGAGAAESTRRWPRRCYRRCWKYQHWKLWRKAVETRHLEMVHSLFLICWLLG